MQGISGAAWKDAVLSASGTLAVHYAAGTAAVLSAAGTAAVHCAALSWGGQQ